MYSLPPILDQSGPIPLPTCMYRLPIIQGIPAEPLQNRQQTAPPPTFTDPDDLITLERRQDDILKRLSNLKKELESTRSSLGLPKSSIMTVPCSSSSDKEFDSFIDQRQDNILKQISSVRGSLNKLLDLCKAEQKHHRVAQIQNTSISSSKLVSLNVFVIQASPTNPPWAIRSLIQEFVTKSNVGFETSNFKHSSLKEPLPQNLEDFLLQMKPDLNASRRISVVWKDGIVEPQVCLGLRTIRGEANIARLLSRAFAGTDNYENGRDVNTSDDILDLIQDSLIWGTRTEAQKFLSKVEPQIRNKTISLNSLASKVLASSLLNARNVTVSPETKKWADSALNLKTPLAIGEGESSARSSLLTFLTSNGISFENIEHPEVFTVEAMMPYLKHVKGAVTKNLFLKDKNKKLYLLSALHDRKVDMKEIAKKAGTKELRFGDENILHDKLGVKEGCVSAFALMNDKQGEVQFLVDEALVDGSHSTVFFHPLVNTATTGISCNDFRKFIELTGHKFNPIKF